jgi:mRNA interferase HicA
VKRADLIRRIQRAAIAKGHEFGLLREGAAHSLFLCGDKRVVIPRHREINELTARGIMRDLQELLGKDWWL